MGYEKEKELTNQLNKMEKEAPKQEEPTIADSLITEIREMKVDSPKQPVQQQAQKQRLFERHAKFLFLVFTINALAIIGCIVYLLWF